MKRDPPQAGHADRDSAPRPERNGHGLAPEASAGRAGNRARSEALRGGVPLDPDVRADMEARFQADFDSVRVHDHAAANRDAAVHSALAYTVGDDIAFGPGAYAPRSSAGRRLLAHELAHVVQQRRGGPDPALSPQAPHEHAADAAAAQVDAGASAVHVEGGTAVGLARAPVPQPDDPDTARRREVTEREATERAQMHAQFERQHAETVLSLWAFRRREHRFIKWFAHEAAVHPGTVLSATQRLLGPYGFGGTACKEHFGVGDYLADFDAAVAVWAVATKYRYLRRDAINAPIFDPEGDAARMDQVILDELPDGTGYIGRRRDFIAVQDAQIKERNLRVAQNIGANVFGAIGWAIDGEAGSEAGAALGDVVTGGRGRGRPVRSPRSPRSRGSRTSRSGARVRRGSGGAGTQVPTGVSHATGGSGKTDVAPPNLAPPGQTTTTATAPDPLVVVPIQGTKKGRFWRQGSPEFAQHGGSTRKPPSRTHVVMPESQARLLGFREASEPATHVVTPRRIGGLQVESAGAGRMTEHPITARTSRKAGRSTGPELEAPKANESAQHGFDRTIKADLAQAQGHNTLIDRGELGILRANNVSTPGVDSITATVDSHGNARVYLNDFTSPGTRKAAKPTHERWGRELDAATAGNRLDFGGREIGGVKIEVAIRRAIDNGEVYVRPVHVSLPAEAAGGKAEPTVTFGAEIRLKKKP